MRFGVCALVALVVLAMLGLWLGFFDSKNDGLRTALETTPAGTGRDRGDILAPDAAMTDFALSVNLPALFLNDVTFQKGLTSSQIATLAGGLVTNNQDGDFGTGIVTAANIPTTIVSGLTAGSGVSVTQGATPTIANTGVLSLAGSTGAVSLSQGSGITISDLTISNSGVTSLQGQTGAVTLAGGTGITVSGTTVTNSLPSQWTTSGSAISYTTGNVGIGTTTPTQLFEVAGGSGVVGQFSGRVIGGDAVGSNEFATLGQIAAGAGQYWQRNSGTLSPTNITDDLLLGSTATSSALVRLGGTPNANSFFNTGGNVGIGTTTPANKLHISGGSILVQTPIGGATFERYANDNTAPNIVSAKSRSTTIGTQGIVQDNDILLRINGRGSDGSAFLNAGQIAVEVDGTPGASDMPGRIVFWTTPDGSSSLVERLRITNSGNIGIGTTAPTAKLEIANSNAFNPASNIASAALLGGNFGGGLLFKDTAYAGIWATDSGQTLNFNSNGTSSGFGGAFGSMVLKNGNVGIGTTTPGAKLDIAGSASLSANLAFAGSGTAHTLDILDGGTLNIRRSPGGVAGQATAMFIGANGNVGIGTTGPSNILDVVGPANSDAVIQLATGGTSGFRAKIGLNNAGTGGRNYQIYSTNNGDGGFGGGKFVINDTTAGAGVGRLVIDSNGNVGIGTTTPLGKLNVSGAATGKALAIFNETGDQALFTASASGTTRFTIASSGTLTASAYGAGVAQFSSAGLLSSSALNLAGGATLITGTLPLANGGTNANLTAVAGGIIYSGPSALGIGSAGTTGQLLTSGGTGAPTWVDAATVGTNYWQRTLGTLAPLNITDDLLLGGTSSTSARFAFLNTAAGTPTASLSGNLAVAVPTGANPAATLNILNGGSLNLQTSVGGNAGLNSRLFIANTGNVGIGTTGPGMTLDVNGGIRAKPGAPGAFNVNKTGYSFSNGGDDDGGMFSSANGQIEFYSNSAEVMRIASGGNVGIGTTTPGAQLDLSTDSARKLTTTTWTTGSDARIKTQVQTISDALDIIGRVRPVKYHYTPEYRAAHPSIADTDYYSFIAQEFQQVFPQSVTEIDGLLYLNSSNMIPYAIAGIKALDQKLSLQESRVTALAALAPAAPAEVPSSVPGESSSLAGNVATLGARVDQIAQLAQQTASEAAFLRDLMTAPLGIPADTPALARSLAALDVADTATISGTLSVLGRTTVADLGVTGQISAGLLSIDGLAGELGTLAGPLKLQAAGLGGVEFVGGKLTIDKEGNLHTSGQVSAKTVRTEKLDIDTADPQAAAAGKGAIPAGEDRITIETSRVTSSSLIFVTATAETDVPLVVDQVLPGRAFTVEVVRPQPHAVTFNWWVIN